MNSYDVIVCGAGPAGMTTALFLARAGKRVMIIEKEVFPRDKVCADNKTWKCTDIVKELGLWNEFQKLQKADIMGVKIVSPSGHEMNVPLLPEDIQEKGPWYNVRRKEFDNMLANECKKNKNIEFRENCMVERGVKEVDKNYAPNQLAELSPNLPMTGVQFRNEAGDKEYVFAKVVVGADGSSSVIAESAGVPSKVKGRYAVNVRAYYEGVKGVSKFCELYYLTGICPGYFWIFPVDDHTVNVGIGMRPEELEKQGKTLEQKLAEVLQMPQFKSRFSNSKQVSEFGFAGLSVLGKKKACSGNGWLLVGDAGTFAMTFSGEGCGPGMRTGKIAAEAIVEAINAGDVSAKGLKRYDDKLWNILGKEVSGFYWLELLLLHPTLFDFVAARAKNNKDLIRIASRMNNHYETASELIAPGTILKLLFS